MAKKQKNSAKILRLVLGDQLNERHSWFHKTDRDVTYVIMEIRQETDYVKHHIQKVAAFFAAMQNFAEAIRKKGHAVVYLHLDACDNEQTIEGNLARLITQHKFARFEYLLPDEYRLDVRMKEIAKGLPIDCRSYDAEHFLTEREAIKKQFSGKKRFLMESFYRAMRKKHDILMEKDKPAGGRWNYDQKNRQAYDGRVPIPDPKVFANDVSSIVKMIRTQKVKTFGEIDTRQLVWPVNRKQALEALDFFLTYCLPDFGTYQDAMTLKSWSLFHSRLSFALNTKMLHPMEVIEAAIMAWQNKTGKIEIQQVEGFVRQILGWREYMRGVYWALMPEFGSMNFLEHDGSLPDCYWTGETRMRCMREAIGQSLKHAYAHHIQRLMVTGNFALLAGVHPDQVDDWYLGVYIDAVQWVEMPNTRAMSQFADGGIVATKPYISSANYIQKMSDYCGACEYDWKQKHGQNACPFNALYWDFMERHRSKLQKNPRMAAMYRTWERMAAEKRKPYLRQAQHYRANLNEL